MNVEGRPRVSERASRPTPQVFADSRVRQGGRSEETNSEPLRRGKVRGAPRSAALLPEERNGVEESS